ncbi:hypothetical protein CBM2599_B50307 [Cupriavidus taiwanensis]|nr:hypothetical protein CBM2599_B50307 [Cupriavidus taiwanensis]
MRRTELSYKSKRLQACGMPIDHLVRLSKAEYRLQWVAQYVAAHQLGQSSYQHVLGGRAILVFIDECTVVGRSECAVDRTTFDET